MRRGWRVVFGWGVLLGVLASWNLAFSPPWVEVALGFGMTVACLLLGLVFFGGERRELEPRPERAEPTPVPDLSPASVAIALGLAFHVAGWELGPWAMAIGGGIFAIGVGGLVRELRAQRAGGGAPEGPS